MKHQYFIFIFFFVTITGFAQIDQNRSIKIEGLDFKLDTVNDVHQPKFDFSLKIPSTLQFSNEAKNNNDQFEFMKYVNNRNNSNSFMSQNESDSEKDVLKIRYWQGKDVSNERMETTRELGRIDTTSKNLRIECRDHSFVDGDRVRVFLNEKVIYNNIVLVGSTFTINVKLKEGFNRIDIQALNQGTSGPNTAEFFVFDDSGNMIARKGWNMLTGNIATLVVIKN